MTELYTVEQFWDLDQPPIDGQNYRKKGWSEVLTTHLTMPDGTSQKVYIKRQQNYFHKTIMHPFRGRSTLLREHHYLQVFKELGFCVPEVVYFGERKEKGQQQAVLVIKNLDDYVSCFDLNFQSIPFNEKKELFRNIAQTIARFHQQRIRHSCLYPKHIFLNLNNPALPMVALIDLEKVKRTFFKKQAYLHDLKQLHRRTLGISLRDRLRFLEYYRAEIGIQWPIRRLVTWLIL